MGAAIGIIPGGKLVKMFMKNGGGKAIGNAMKGFGATAKNMVGSRLAKAGGWVARKAKKFVGKGCSSGCFAAATMVWTANGAVPIVEIEEGQQVLAAPDDGLAESYASNEVGTKIIVGEASLVQLVLLHEDGSSEVLNTTDEHPFHVADTAAWTRADQLIIGDELSTITSTAKLQSVIYTTERVPVYNLSIPGSPTYYVGERGVWVHNCSGRQLKGFLFEQRVADILGARRVNREFEFNGWRGEIDLEVDGAFIEATGMVNVGGKVDQLRKLSGYAQSKGKSVIFAYNGYSVNQQSLNHLKSQLQGRGISFVPMFPD